MPLGDAAVGIGNAGVRRQTAGGKGCKGRVFIVVLRKIAFDKEAAPIVNGVVFIPNGIRRVHKQRRSDFFAAFQYRFKPVYG